MYGWAEQACRGCSFVADQVAHLAHLNARDTTLVFASRAPQKDINRLKARMGWKMPWYTIMDSFEIDFGVDEWHARMPSSATAPKYSARISSTTVATSRWGAPGITSTSRRSGARRREDSPEGYPQTEPYKWWNWHDNYDVWASPDPEWVEVSDAGEAAFRKRDAEAKA